MPHECSGCATCCKMFLINLSEEEYNSGKYKTQFQDFGIVKDFAEAELTAANILPRKKDGSCIYLENSRCSIHETKPLSCKKFFCASGNPDFKLMIDEINKHKLNSTLTG